MKTPPQMMETPIRRRTPADLLWRLLSVFMLYVLGATGLPGQSAAQEDLFSTAITVNGDIITNYELEQRERMLILLRSPGDPVEEARKGLIDDRLRLQEAKRVGIVPSEEEIKKGMEEFAGRANLSATQFIGEIGKQGVAEETFRDFVTAGLAWRSYVQQRFGPQSRVTPDEVDRALSLQSQRPDARLLLAEIILPLPPQLAERNRALAKRLSNTLKTEPAFSAAARKYSASSTRERGGRLDWMPLANIPPQLRSAVLTLAPGEVSDPIDLGNAVGIFQLRGLEENTTQTPETQILDYVTLLFPGGRTAETISEARAFSQKYDTCDDLYTPAKELPAGYFDRKTTPIAKIPGDIALELAKLDDNEVSTALTRQNGEFLLYLMLCSRRPETPVDDEGKEIDLRRKMQERLFNQRISSFADGFLEELRSDAVIVTK